MDFSITKVMFLMVSATLLVFITGSASRFFSTADSSELNFRDLVSEKIHSEFPNAFELERPNLARMAEKYRQNKLKLSKEFSPHNDCKTAPFLAAVTCDVCDYVVTLLKYLVRTGGAQSDIVAFSKKTCIALKIEDEPVCNAVIEEFQDELFSVALKLALTPKEACGYILGTDCGAPFNPQSMWNVTFPSVPKPPVVPPKPPKAGSPTLRVLHITDFHYDPEYVPGSNAECGEPLCCRSNDGSPEPGHTGAGMYGDYRNCDSSKSSIDSVFQYLYAIRDQYDYVIFTGDIPPHNVWNQSRSDQLTALKFFTDTVKKYLPGKQVFNAVGNHESAPVNSYPPPFITGKDSESWLYNALADSWLTWLPTNTKATITKAGFYAASPFPGLKIISLNMNMCNNENWWLLINGTDPAGMLQWFISELQDAEDKGIKVHVIGHIMPGCDCCLKPFSWNYYKIINRYESTIVEQFFGHSHANYYEMFYDDVIFRRPIGVAYIPGSITTYSNLNPGFRIYEIDGNYTGSTWRVQDYTNYYLNLTEANLVGKAQWQKEYSAKEEFGMQSLFPADWNNLIYEMRTNDTLFQKMCVHYQKSAPNTCSTCTGDCRKGFLCNLKTGRNGDPNICKDL